MKENNELVNKIEAILFYTSDPVSLSFLVKTLEEDKKSVLEAIEKLKEKLKEGGVRVVEHDGEYSLVTAPEYSKLIEKIIKEERERELGRAGIEILSIIAYKGPVTKKEIEYIRGVNSQYALRSLLLRGLVERKSRRDDERVIEYSITSETLKYLGLQNLNELPEYADVRAQLEVESVEESETQEENGQQ